MKTVLILASSFFAFHVGFFAIRRVANMGKGRKHTRKAVVLADLWEAAVCAAIAALFVSVGFAVVQMPL